MKLKTDFITNSSSTAYIIINTSNQDLTLADFAIENLWLLERFHSEYNWYKDDQRYSELSLLESAANREIEFKPGKYIRCVFGDEQGDVVGHVYDYILRTGGQSKNFRWMFQESLR